jgi:glycopeptide antibiotics resistance protein
VPGRTVKARFVEIMNRRVILAIVLVAYIVFLLDIALFRFPATTRPNPNWVPFHMMVNDWQQGGWEFVINFVGNLVAFLPMGFLPPLIRVRRTTIWHAALFSLAISFAIEAGQYVSGRRVPDVDDLILNTAGGVLGYFAAQAIILSRQSSPRAAP